MGTIASVNSGQQVQTDGFEQADPAAHMLAWLGRPGSVEEFVVGDVEAELYRQTPNAQLLSLHLVDAPAVETQARPVEGASQVAVEAFEATLPLVAEVNRDGEHWMLSLNVRYRLRSSPGTPPELNFDFQVLAAKPS
jgi:hypothetical protein